MAGGHQGNFATPCERKSGRHRIQHRRLKPFAWLGASAITLGVGAALASGSGVAHADNAVPDDSKPASGNTGSGHQSSGLHNKGLSTTRGRDGSPSSTIDASGQQIAKLIFPNPSITNTSRATAASNIGRRESTPVAASVAAASPATPWLEAAKVSSWTTAPPRLKTPTALLNAVAAGSDVINASPPDTSATASSAATIASAVIATVSVGGDPGEVAVNPDGHTVYVANHVWGLSNTLSVIDASTNGVTDTITVHGPYEGSGNIGMVVSPDGSKVYLADDLSNAVSVIDTNNKSIINTIPYNTSTSSSNLVEAVVISPDGKHLYVTHGASYDVTSHVISVIDTSNNTVVTGISGANGYDVEYAAISPDGQHLYVPYRYAVYVGNQEVGINSNVLVIDTSTNTVSDTISLGDYATGVAVSPDGNHLYATTTSDTPGSYAGNLLVIDTATNTVSNTISLDNYGNGLAVSPDGQHVYVSTNPPSSNGLLLVIDTAHNTVINTINVGDGANGVAVSPDGSRVYVANEDGGTVSVIDAAIADGSGSSSDPFSGVPDSVRGAISSLSEKVNNSSQDPVANFFLNPDIGLFAQAASLGEDALSVIGPVGTGAASLFARLNPVVSLGLGVSEFANGTTELTNGHFSGAVDYAAGFASILTVGLEATPGFEEFAPVAATAGAALEGLNFLGKSFLGW
jgi:YVTN family beta-propeller protein